MFLRMDSATESFLETLGELPDITKWTAEEIKGLENFVTTKMAEKKNKAKRLRVLEALVNNISFLTDESHSIFRFFSIYNFRLLRLKKKQCIRKIF